MIYLIKHCYKFKRHDLNNQRYILTSVEQAGMHERALAERLVRMSDGISTREYYSFIEIESILIRIEILREQIIFYI